MHGFLIIDKPAGLTSHDVVARVRRLAQQRRVGHAGTLDPAATGVLVVALGGATRLVEYVQEGTTKRYQARVGLGMTTTTDDAEGATLAIAPVPALDRVQLEQVLEPFRGTIAQVPPMYAALHHDGQRLHTLARAGQVVERTARTVTIEQLDLIDWSPPWLALDIVCSKGTYIRALARDIGSALGCGGYLHTLRRTAVGTFLIDDAISLDRLVADAAALATYLLPPDRAVIDWPSIQLNQDEARQVRNGQALMRTGTEAGKARVYGPDGILLALMTWKESCWKPEKVFDWTP